MKGSLQFIAGFKWNSVVLIEEYAELGMCLYIKMNYIFTGRNYVVLQSGLKKELYVYQLWVVRLEDAAEFWWGRNVSQEWRSSSRNGLRTICNDSFFEGISGFFDAIIFCISFWIPNRAHVAYLRMVTYLKINKGISAVNSNFIGSKWMDWVITTV